MDVLNGSHAYVSYNWTSTPVWTHGLYIVVDQSNAISESNEANNIAYKNIYVRSLPDLSVSPSDISFVPSVVYNGVSTIIRAVIRNL